MPKYYILRRIFNFLAPKNLVSSYHILRSSIVMLFKIAGQRTLSATAFKKPVHQLHSEFDLINFGCGFHKFDQSKHHIIFNQYPLMNLFTYEHWRTSLWLGLWFSTPASVYLVQRSWPSIAHQTKNRSSGREIRVYNSSDTVRGATGESRKTTDSEPKGI